MKKVAFILMFVLGIATNGWSNEPSSIDGTYKTTKVYIYDFARNFWEDKGAENHELFLSTAEGIIEFQNQKFSIIKMKEKHHKKNGAIEYKLTLTDENGAISLASLVLVTDANSNKPRYQFYLSNETMEASFDLEQ